MISAIIAIPATPATRLERKTVKDRVIKRPMNPDTVVEQQDRCYQLRLTGMSLRGIAARTGLALGTVHKRLQAAMTERQQQGAAS